jgi:hypothetical protein
MSVEVKDLHISLSNLEQQLGSFLKQVQGNQILGVAFVLSIDDEASSVLTNSEVKPFTQSNLIQAVDIWDWQKQNTAVHGVLHYLAHIEQNPKAVDRILEFINERNPEHDSLAYYQS